MGDVRDLQRCARRSNCRATPSSRISALIARRSVPRCHGAARRPALVCRGPGTSEQGMKACEAPRQRPGTTQATRRVTRGMACASDACRRMSSSFDGFSSANRAAVLKIEPLELVLDRPVADTQSENHPSAADVVEDDHVFSQVHRVIHRQERCRHDYGRVAACVGSGAPMPGEASARPPKVSWCSPQRTGWPTLSGRGSKRPGPTKPHRVGTGGRPSQSRCSRTRPHPRA